MKPGSCARPYFGIEFAVVDSTVSRDPSDYSLFDRNDVYAYRQEKKSRQRKLRESCASSDPGQASVRILLRHF